MNKIEKVLTLDKSHMDICGTAATNYVHQCNNNSSQML